MIHINFISKYGINGNYLKLIAMATMLLDHIGLVLFPHIGWLRVVGRISFPIYAFLIAEGCYYTKNRTRHFLEVFLLGVICQVGYSFVSSDLYFGVLITFSVSILLCYLALEVKKGKISFFYLLLAVVAVWFANNLLYKNNIIFDYGFEGIILPVIIILANNYYFKVLFSAIGILVLSLSLRGNQWWSLLSIIPIALYNGKRGKVKLKYVFYLFYPLHLLIIYGIGVLIN